jgi:two-component system chemotaxis sensor kinase CheA
MVDLSDRFRRETSEQLRSLSANLLELEQSYDRDEPAWGQRERLGELFRTAHSLKGKFGTEGLTETSELAHALEDLLDAVAKGRLEPTGATLDDALDAVDALQAVVDEGAAGGDAQTNLTHAREQLRDHVASAGEGSAWSADESASGGEEPSDGVDEEELAPEVQEALDGAVEFDDLDSLLEDVEDEPDLTEETSGWGVFDDEDRGVGAKDVDDGDGSADEESRELTDMNTFEDLRADLDPDEEELDDLQADIDAEEFGEFDEDDDMSIRDLLDVEPVGDAPVSDVDPGTDEDARTTREDMAAFDDVRESFDPDEEELDDLQADIDATEFGEFDDDDDMSIRELLEADASDLDPEAALDDGRAADGEAAESAGVDAATAEPADGESEATPDDAAPAADTTPDVEPALADEPVDADVEATADADVEATADADESTGDDDSSADGDAFEFEQVTTEDDPLRSDASAASGDADEPVESTADVGADAPGDADAVDEPAGAASVDDADDGSDPFDDADDGSDPFDDADDGGDLFETDDAADSVGGSDPDDLLAGGSPDEAAAGGADEPFDLGDEDPFGMGEEGESLPDLADLPDEDEALDDALAELGEWDGDDVPADAGGGASDLAEDFAFGFGQEGDLFDALEYDSLFTKYFAADGTLFGESAESGRWSAEFIEDTDLDAERFASLADPDWNDRVRNGDGRRADGVQSLSVDVENADRLLGLIEEIGAVQRRLERIADGESDASVEDVVSDMRPVASDLRHTVMDVRLMPLDVAVSGLPRVVRDIAREQGKNVDFSVSGSDVKLDRSIIDRIGDPLVHLVRNAVDHGIETPEERRREGKPPEGRLELRARRERDEVVVELEDDGRGIDPDAVRQAALDSDIVDDEEVAARSDEEVYDLLFHPQFSTRDEVTEVSGRGVGLEVVDRTVRDLTGDVTVESTPGEGTTIRLRLPVSIAVAPVLFVRSGDEEYAIPTSAVETTEIADHASTFERVAGRYGISFGDAGGGDGSTTAASAPSSADLGPSVESAPDAIGGDDRDDDVEYETVWLSEAFDVAGPVGDEDRIVRVLDSVRPIEIRCEAVEEIQEVVVRPFEDVLGGTPGINGTTGGDGDGVVPVVDVRTI